MRDNEPWSLRQIRKNAESGELPVNPEKINPFSKEKKELREEIAKHCHDVWSHWMKYMFEQCEITSFGAALIPYEKVDRWVRQMLSDYENLSEEEKKSDRKIADGYIKLFKELSGE